MKVSVILIDYNNDISVVEGDGYVGNQRIVLCRIKCLAWQLSAWIGLFAVLTCVSASGQSTSFVSDLRSKLDRYYNQHVPLNLDVQFNQPSYVPGDTAWLSLWLTTEREGLPVADQQIVRVDLSTREGSVIQQICVMVKNGRGQGQINVPASIEPGIYTAIFSTGWLGSGERGICGYKEFIVSGENVFATGNMPLKFHIEGGNLIEDVDNQILVTGKPDATVSLTANEQVLKRITLDDLGYGHVMVRPVAELHYSLNDGNETSRLPAAQPGVTMSLSFYDSAAALLFNVASTRPRNGCNLAIVSRGKLVYSALIGLQDRSATITVPRRVLPEGVMVATVFDENNNPLAERIFLANQASAPVKVVAEHLPVQPRSSIPISIEDGEPGMMLTVSIYAEDMFAPWQSFHNAVESIARLPLGALDFRVDPSWTLRQWNAFLITQKWNRFSWRDVWNGTPRYHAPEKYLRFKGRILQSGSSSFDSVRVTFFLRNDARVYEEFVDRNGAFDVELYFDFFNTEEVIYTIDRKGKVIPGASLSLDKDIIPPIKLSPSMKTRGRSDPYFAFAAFRKSVSDAYSDHLSGAVGVTVADANASVEDELFAADVTVRLDDYVLFPDMEETLREIVPKLQHRWRGRHHSVTVALSEPDGLATDDPLYFIDGILTDDTDYFMGLKPVDVATIKVISSHRKLSSMGMLGRNGIVLVTTKIPNNAQRVPHVRNSFLATGLTPLATFDNVPHTSTRTPILRSSVYFNPELKLNSEGRGTWEVFLPDNTGKFRIEVTGLTRSGTVFKSITHLHSLAPTSAP
ncbi:hypothetical protein WBG78_15335 [Chryseolinea sp. T2]|uniref:hypothetical protein n=1 Tax=Chryseolinea sp. T2 TaxID=3129255 RepID=UPI003076D0E4